MRGGVVAYSAERCNTSTPQAVWCGAWLALDGHLLWIKGSEFWRGCQGVWGIFILLASLDTRVLRVTGKIPGIQPMGYLLNPISVLLRFLNE